MLAILIGASVLVDLVILGRAYDLNKSDWSGWVQAIGSVSALGVAIYVMSRQNAHAARLAADTDKRILMRRAASLEALIDRGYEMSQSLEKHAEGISSFYDYFFTLVHPEEIEAITHALKEIPLYTLESYKLVIGIHELTINLDRLEPYVLIHQTSGDVHYKFEDEDASQVKYICGKIREARDKVNAGFKDLGHTPRSSLQSVEHAVEAAQA